MKLRPTVVRLLQTTRLNRLVHHLYYNHVHGFDAATRSTLSGIEKTFNHAERTGTLSGRDYYEFGIFKGYSFWWAQKIARQLNVQHDMRFYGFDSFEGLPEVTGPDKTRRKDFYKGQYACSYQTVCKELERAGVDWNRTKLIRGFFNESLTPQLREKLGMRPAAIALIDCDLYASTVDVLRFIEPLITTNSILVFDDWNCFNADNERGQRKAFTEFISQHAKLEVKPLFEYGSWGQAFRIR